MSRKNILDIPDRKLKELFQRYNEEINEELGHQQVNVNDAVKYYKEKFLQPYQGLSITPTDTSYIQSRAMDVVEIAIGQSFRGYTQQREKIENAYQETKDWNKVITTVVYWDVSTSLEAFIDEVEEVYKTEVRDAQHLQELTGITEEEGETLEGLAEAVTTAKYNRYYRALVIILSNGGTYSDLIQVEPGDYGLPEEWDGTLGTDRMSSVNWVLGTQFSLDRILPTIPNLRYLAEDIQAPYSVIMDAYSVINHITPEKAEKEIESLKNKLGLSAYEKAMKLISDSLADKFKADIEAMSEQEKIDNRYLPHQPEIPKTKKGIKEAVDKYIEEEAVNVCDMLINLGLLYDSWGEDAVSKELADKLREQIDYKEENGELHILESEEGVIEKTRALLLQQPIDTLTALSVFGDVVTEEEASKNISFRIKTLPEIIINEFLKILPLDNQSPRSMVQFSNIKKVYPKQCKAIKYNERFYSKLPPDALLENIAKILK